MNFPPAALNDGWIVAVIKLVESDHATAFDLKALASLAGHSPFHFQRRFREIMGESASDYIRRTRLEKAAWDLLANNQSVLTVALNWGYASAETFTRAFHRNFGVPPSSYRRSMRAEIGHDDQERAARARIDHHPHLQLIGMRFHYRTREELGQYWKHFAMQLRAQGLDMNAQAVAVKHDFDAVTRPGLRRYTCAIVDTGMTDVEPRLPLTRFSIAEGDYASLECSDCRAEIRRHWFALFSAWTHAVNWMRPVMVGHGGLELYQEPPWEQAPEASQVKLMLRIH